DGSFTAMLAAAKGDALRLDASNDTLSASRDLGVAPFASPAQELIVPQRLGRFTSLTKAGKWFVTGIANNSAPMAFYDATDPLHPGALVSASNNLVPTAVIGANGRIYAASNSGVINVLDGNQPAPFW